MNYQSSALLFYSGKLFLAILLLIALTFFGVSAPLFWLLAIGLGLTLAISLRLHVLKERGVVMLPQVSSDWTVYVNGIPVHEKRNILTNPGFFSVDRARLFFANMFGIKLIIQLAVFIALLQQANHSRVSFWLVMIVAVWMLYGIWRSAHALLAILTRNWLIENLQSASGSEWYRGYIAWRGQPESALDRVLSLS